jgi:hypothetical protein
MVITISIILIIQAWSHLDVFYVTVLAHDASFPCEEVLCQGIEDVGAVDLEQLSTSFVFTLPTLSSNASRVFGSVHRTMGMSMWMILNLLGLETAY